MSENGEIKSKNEIIADLYALRAGLSIISEQTDGIMACEENSRLAEKTVKDFQNNIDRIERNIDRLKADLLDLQGKREKAQTEYDNYVSKKEQKIEIEENSARRKYSFWTPMHISVLLASIIFPILLQSVLLPIGGFYFFIGLWFVF